MAKSRVFMIGSGIDVQVSRTKTAPFPVSGMYYRETGTIALTTREGASRKAVSATLAHEYGHFLNDKEKRQLKKQASEKATRRFDRKLRSREVRVSRDINRAVPRNLESSVSRTARGRCGRSPARGAGS